MHRTDSESKLHFTIGLKMLLCVALTCVIAFRFAVLNADPDWRMDWSTGLFTDEAFYLTNARNAIVFGQESIGEFNNKVLNPVLHFLHLGIFKLFGVGYLPARLMSAFFGLMSCLFLALAFGRFYGRHAGIAVLAIFGIDYAFIAFNRLGLMETPIAFLLTLAVWLYSLCYHPQNKEASQKHPLMTSRADWLLATCGIACGLAVISKLTAGVVVPAFLCCLFMNRERRLRSILMYSLGFGVVITIWQIFWVHPNQDSFNAMMHYYRTYQIQPQSWGRLGQNILVALFGYEMGWAHFHFTRAPIAMLLALTSIPVLYRNKTMQKEAGGLPALLFIWFGLYCLALTFSSYSPSRYYVISMPALNGFALWFLFKYAMNNRESVQSGGTYTMPSFLLWKRDENGRLNLKYYNLICLLFFTYHLSALFIQHSALALCTTIAVIIVVRTKFAWMPTVACVVLLNMIWFGSWFINRTYNIEKANMWANQLPINTVIVGECAPMMTVNTPLQSVMVIPKLANWNNPIETYNADYVAVIEPVIDWWKTTYPDVFIEKNTAARFTMNGKSNVAVYRTPKYKAMNK